MTEPGDDCGEPFISKALCFYLGESREVKRGRTNGEICDCDGSGDDQLPLYSV